MHQFDTEESLGPDRPILVTGASGLLGANLTMSFAQGRRVVPIYYNHRSRWQKQLQRPAISRTLPQLQSCCQRGSHPWSFTAPPLRDVDWCEINPQEAMRINAEVSRQLAAHGRARGRGLRIHFDRCGVRWHFRRISRERLGRRLRIGTPVVSRPGEEAVLRAMPEALVLRVNIYGWNLQAKNSLAEWVLRAAGAGRPSPRFFRHDVLARSGERSREWIPRSGGFRLQWRLSRRVVRPRQQVRFARRNRPGVSAGRRRWCSESLGGGVALTATRPRNTWLTTDKILRVRSASPCPLSGKDWKISECCETMVSTIG